MEDTENMAHTVVDVISCSCMIESRLRISLLRAPCACLCAHLELADLLKFVLVCAFRH